MSLSTKAISSSCFCHCCSDTGQEGALEGWRRELRNRLIVDKASGAEFLSKYVPSRTTSSPPGDIKKALAKFERWNPLKGHEVDSYPDLLKALAALVSSFPADKRPDFMDCHKIMQRFPSTAFAKNHHPTYPDIAISFPGKKLDPDKSPDWFGLSGIMEAKSESREDPFKKKGLKHCKTLVQLAVNARNLMHAHGLTCVFVFGIYGAVMRICRFDHSGAVVCRPLNLKDVDDLKVARQFFWNFVHPTEAGPFVGWDPTVRRLSTDDEKWLVARLKQAKVHVDTTKFPLAEARSLQVFDGEDVNGGEPQTFIAFKILDVNGRLFSRATTVWHGIRDTRRLVRGRLTDPRPSVNDLRVRVIKESWRQTVRRSEKEFYDRLDLAVPLCDRIGLPSLVCGVDLGEREVRLWESALYGAPKPVTLDGAHHKSRLCAPASQQVSTPPPSLSASSSSLNRPVHRPMQQTFTWRQAKGAKYWYRERSHMRFVVAEVGRPVTRFRNTKELVMAFRDAIIGHRTAMTKGGILHRDISVGNILTVDDPSLQDGFCGFIHDFDYSSISREVPHGDILTLTAEAVDNLLLADDVQELLKERTGTFLFMAADLLANSGEPIIHSTRHDLESFYWTLLWVVLRHTDNKWGAKRQGGQLTYADTFKQDDATNAQSGKSGWLRHRAKFLDISRNCPLTTLMKEFALLVYYEQLDYDNVLALFDTALAAESWPATNDGPLEYIPPDLRTVNDFLSSEEDLSHQRRRHARKRARAQAGKGKARETTPEQSDDDPDEDYDDPWESADDDEMPAAIDADDAERDQGGAHRESVRHQSDSDPSAAPGFESFDDEDWQDAADVSAMLRCDIDMEDPDFDVDAAARSFQGLTLSRSPRMGEASSSGVAESQTESRSNQPRVQRRVAAAPTGNDEPRQGPRTRAQTTQAAGAAAAIPQAAGMIVRGGVSRSGPQTRSIARTGHSGGTGGRSEGSQRGSRGSRRA
ncbi:hypothetical protein V8D89_001728 [Ganoderma adspersum]